MGRKGNSSGRWIERQRTDHYVRQRDQHGYRSRAAYKLKELAARDQLLRAGDTVLDLGAAPGGWTQVAVELAGPRGTVIATDILPMAEVPGARFLLGDCRDPALQAEVLALAGAAKVDLVLSDMAPNISGVRDVDEAGMVELADIALDLAEQVLKPGGALLIKLFQFADTELLVRRIRLRFKSVSRRKPEASRAESREFYVVAKHYGL